MVVNGIAALVGKSVITREQVQRVAAPLISAHLERYGDRPDVLRRQIELSLSEVLERLVERRLILQEFEDMNVAIPESIIDDHIDEQIRRRFGSDRALLTKTLQEEGSTSEGLRREIREQFIEIIMRQRNVPRERDILISPGRIERYYLDNQDRFRIADQVKLSMIVIDKSRSLVDPLRLAREIQAKLDEGASFAEMAAVYSDGSQAREGGSWGWVERSVLREDLAEIAFSMQPDTRSDLIDKPEAVYLMQVDDVRAAHVRPLSEVRDEIERTLTLQERARLEQQWLDRLRRKTFVARFWDLPSPPRATAEGRR